MWLHSSVGRASHRYRGGHGFESRWSPDFFQASSFQLLKLENLLRWSHFTSLITNVGRNLYCILLYWNWKDMVNLIGTCQTFCALCQDTVCHTCSIAWYSALFHYQIISIFVTVNVVFTYLHKISNITATGCWFTMWGRESSIWWSNLATYP